jgi:hypothetical protein
VERMSSRWSSRLVAATLVVVLASACVNRKAMLAQLLEARQTASELQVEFTRASDAASRAVMSDSDEATATAVEESKEARKLVEKNAEKLRPLLGSLGFDEELRHLEGFRRCFDEYRRLEEMITLSRQNSDVRSLALCLERRLMLSAQCEDQLQALEQALATHRFTATR